MLALLPILMPLITSVLGKVVPDLAEREKASTEIELMLAGAITKANQDQVALNKIEAAHKSIFVAGWRPMIGWTLALALAYQFVVAPFAYWATTAYGVEIPPLPSLDDNLWELLTGMLGMAGLRTFEKLKVTA
mgnify:FL=1|tara:strand:+ start:12655 stop:13053 length:399 start_codon:yes stop_codon:yes gene_type:complete